jgi:hypothetical protein
VRNKAPSDFHIYSDGRPEQSTGTYCRHVGLVAARPETAFWEITPVMSPPRHLEASSNLKGPDVKDYRHNPGAALIDSDVQFGRDHDRAIRPRGLY